METSKIYLQKNGETPEQQHAGGRGGTAALCSQPCNKLKKSSGEVEGDESWKLKESKGLAWLHFRGTLHINHWRALLRAEQWAADNNVAESWLAHCCDCHAAAEREPIDYTGQDTLL